MSRTLLKLLRLWAFMGFYWWFTITFLGAEELFDLQFMLLFLGYWASWLLFGATVLAFVDEKLRISARIIAWVKDRIRSSGS